MKLDKKTTFEIVKETLNKHNIDIRDSKEERQLRYLCRKGYMEEKLVRKIRNLVNKTRYGEPLKPSFDRDLLKVFL